MEKGYVWKYGDNINTDIIAPPQYLELTIPECAKYTLSPIDETFAGKFKKGDILVLGSNAGSGSSRESAPLVLKELGVKYIVAKSFARIFYRNCVNIGLIPIQCKDTEKIKMGDIIEIDFKQGFICDETINEIFKCDKIPDNIMKIIECGGLLDFIDKYK